MEVLSRRQFTPTYRAPPSCKTVVFGFALGMSASREFNYCANQTRLVSTGTEAPPEPCRGRPRQSRVDRTKMAAWDGPPAGQGPWRPPWVSRVLLRSAALALLFHAATVVGRAFRFYCLPHSPPLVECLLAGVSLSFSFVSFTLSFLATSTMMKPSGAPAQMQRRWRGHPLSVFLLFLLCVCGGGGDGNRQGACTRRRRAVGGAAAWRRCAVALCRDGLRLAHASAPGISLPSAASTALCGVPLSEAPGSTSAFRRNGIIDRRGDFAAAQPLPGRSRGWTRAETVRRSHRSGPRRRLPPQPVRSRSAADLGDPAPPSGLLLPRRRGRTLPSPSCRSLSSLTLVPLPADPPPPASLLHPRS